MRVFRPVGQHPEPSQTFQHRLVPKGAKLAGWAALVQRLGVAAPVRTPSAVAEGHVKGSQRTEGGFAVFDKRYWPGDKITDHLSFALRREPIDLPNEIDFLRRQDEAQIRIMEIVDMPDRLVQDALMFMRQNGGKIPKGRRENEFAALTDEEVERIEAIYGEVFR
jgi:hypothetical protein